MSTFTYKGRTSTGILKEDTIIAESIESARKKLNQQGVNVFLLEAEKPKAINVFGPPKIKAVELMMMTKQLATLIRAGVPILAAVKSIAKQIEHPVLKEAMKKIDASISGGKKLSQALSEHPKIFNEVYVNVVIAGEAGGVLPEVLERLSSLIERDDIIRSEVKGALRYPTYVIIALVFAAVFLINFVVPKFTSMFASFKIDLPLPTKVLMFLSSSMRQYWWVYILLVAGATISFKTFSKTPGGRLALDKLKLNLPVVGELIRKFNFARAANLMSTLIRSGVPALNCIDIVRKTIDNKIIEAEFAKVRKRVESGSPIHEYMEESPIFPAMMTNMVQIGEESGSIDKTLEIVAEHYEKETSYAVKALTGLIEPLITVVTGAMVLGLALAIFVPMWDMSKAANGK